MTNTSESSDRRTLLGHALVFVYGLLIGAANVIPGVSGGTMAFILGIYDKLISAIAAVNAELLRAVLRLDFKRIERILPWRFLLLLALGLGMAAVTLSKGLVWMKDHQPVALFAFFFGLILASVWVVRVRVKKWTPGAYAVLLALTAGMYCLVGLVPRETPDAWWFIFVCGMIASTAMILPGISGSFMLLLVGKWELVMKAISYDSLDFKLMLIFGCGCLAGLALCARALKWLFTRHHDLTVAGVLGLMAGSLRKIWPWQRELDETRVTLASGKVKVLTENFLPDSFSTEVALALALALAGFLAVILMEKLAAKLEKEDAPTQAES